MLIRKIVWSFLTFLLCLTDTSAFCPGEPDLCSTCYENSSAKCETNTAANIIPQNLPSSTVHLQVFYKGLRTELNPSMFERYPQLKRLLISGYNITGIANNTFLSLLSLEQLSVRHTAIQTLPLNLLPSNSSLKILNLEHNQLYEIPTWLFRHTKSLSFLSISYNKVVLSNCSSIGFEFLHLSALVVLNLNQVNVLPSCEDRIPHSFFSPIQNTVKQLDISYTNFFVGNQSLLWKFSQLDTLDITGVRPYFQCASSANGLFQRLPSTLRHLTLRRWNSGFLGCEMTKSILSGLRSLEHIDMKYCDSIFASELTKDLFTGFYNLKTLEIGYTGLRDIQHGTFDDCPLLEHLNLTGNTLGNQPIRPFVSQRLRSLKYLGLRRTGISTDKVRKYHFGNTLGHTPINIIDLSSNYLNYFPEFMDLEYQKTSFWSVSAIHLDHNYLYDLSSGAPFISARKDFTSYCWYILPNLVNLTMNHNRLAKLYNLHNCLTLEHLELRGNNLQKYWKEINEHTISRLYHLKVLDISNNGITSISKSFVAKMTNLTRLILAGNKLSFISPDYFQCNLILEVLDLQSNLLQTFSADQYNFPKLKELLLDSNSFSLLNQSLIEYLETSKSFRKYGLANNPILCDCKKEYFNFFFKWVRTTDKLKDTSSKILCAGPTDELKGRRVLDYKHDPIFCDILPVLIVVLSVAGGIIVALLIGLPLYKYRWYLTHARVVTHAIINQILAVRLEHKYEYDAYILYNSDSEEDIRWIKDILCPAIESSELLMDDSESETAVKLYLVDRDALIGVRKHTEMLSAMERSRKVIVVVSNSFLSSQVCRGQADLAGREAYGQKYYQPNKLLVFVREKLNEDIIEAPFTSLLTEPVIQVHDTPDSEMKRIWKRTKTFITKPRFEFKRKETMPAQGSEDQLGDAVDLYESVTVVTGD